MPDQPAIPQTPATESASVRLMVTALSGFVFVAVGAVIYALPHRATAAGPSILATINAGLNSGATLFLLLGFISIKTKRVAWHRRSMLAAFGLSSLFLLTYLFHHAQVGSVPFRGLGVMRTIYFALLVPHIVLAAAVVPLALLTIYRGWTDRLDLHRKIAKVTLPIWLYVSVSGVALYFMLYHS